MKISDVTLAIAKNYIRQDFSDLTQAEAADEELILSGIMAGAKHYILGETGLTLTELDDYEDLTIAYLALIQDRWDNRNVSGDGKGVSLVVSSILAMHTRSNLL